MISYSCNKLNLTKAEVASFLSFDTLCCVQRVLFQPCYGCGCTLPPSAPSAAISLPASLHCRACTYRGGWCFPSPVDLLLEIEVTCKMIVEGQPAILNQENKGIKSLLCKIWAVSQKMLFSTILLFFPKPSALPSALSLGAGIWLCVK